MATLLDSRIKLLEGSGPGRGIRLVVSDNHGWAEIKIDPSDGNIDGVCWHQH